MNYIPLVHAVQEVTGRRPHLSTCVRWATTGSNGVLLQTAKVGGRRLTTLEWVEQFIKATTDASAPKAMVTAKTPSQADRQAKRDAAKLRERLSKKKPTKRKMRV